MRKLTVVLTAVIVLAAVNLSIFKREHLLSSGRVIYLELAPVDPRSLMQGDYMALNYKVAREALPGFDRDKKNADGDLVVSLDGRNIATFERLSNGAALAHSEALLHYRIRNGQIKFATNAFFFEEGQAQQYVGAHYGEFRVSEDGDMLLTGLRDKDLVVMGAAPNRVLP